MLILIILIFLAAVMKNKRKGSDDLNNKHPSKIQRSSSQDESEALDNCQLALLKKGKRLREILLNDPLDDTMYISNESLTSEISVELTTDPIKIIDEESAVKRIKQWETLGKKCAKLAMAAEVYNLLHLMSLVDIYDSLTQICQDKNTSQKNITNWIIQFMVDNLNIGRKTEQRNRLGCNRLRNLYNEGITSEHLVRAGIKKCNLFVKNECYDFFLSQIPPLEMRHSLTNRSDQPINAFFTENEVKEDKKYKGKRVMFKLKLGKEFKGIVDEDDEYIEF